LYHWLLLMDQIRFCETHFTTYQRFVADHSAISPFLGGSVWQRCIWYASSSLCISTTAIHPIHLRQPWYTVHEYSWIVQSFKIKEFIYSWFWILVHCSHSARVFLNCLEFSSTNCAILYSYRDMQCYWSVKAQYCTYEVSTHCHLWGGLSSLLLPLSFFTGISISRRRYPLLPCQTHPATTAEGYHE